MSGKLLLLTRIVTLTGAAAISAVTVLLDAAFAVMLSWLFLAGVGVFGGLLIAIAMPQKKRVAACVLWTVAVVGVHFIDITPVKPFRRFYESLEPGMSRQHVRELLDRHFPKDGRFRHPTEADMRDGRLSFTLDPENGNYNSEFVIVTFNGDSLVEREYSPD